LAILFFLFSFFLWIHILFTCDMYNCTMSKIVWAKNNRNS
jgi:hypothetical protein